MEKPRIERIVPVFGISSYEEAVAHYVEWLGFTLDWEWREASGEPVIMAISRDDTGFMLNEDPGHPRGADVTLHVSNLTGLADEWNARRPGSVSVQIGLPYEFETLSITDKCGNTLTFQCQDLAEQERLRTENVPKMRDYIRKRRAAGHPFPTPEEVREAVGPVLGFAVEVLNEFPGYADSYRERQTTSS